MQRILFFPRCGSRQQIAIQTADVIIFITDVRQGLVDSDSKVADMLRRSGKPVILAVNKVDSFAKYMPDVYEFYNLGIGDPVPVSAASRLGIGDLLDEVVTHFPEGSGEDEEDDRPRIAIVGKPNVGKSSIINRLLGENRVIVSNIAGTTRDAIDTDHKTKRQRIRVYRYRRAAPEKQDQGGAGAVQHYPYGHRRGACRCGGSGHRRYRGSDRAGCQDRRNRP